MKKIITLLKLSVMMIVLMGFSNLYAQDRVVTGKVTSAEDKEGLPGASVLIKGTTTGTATDVEGNYKISVPNGDAVLVFSFVGLAPIEIAVGNQSTIDVELKSATDLEEVVVIGYGTETKRDLTGAVGSVKASEIKNVAVPTFESALQGRTPGVQITTDNGMAGSPVTVRVRGTSSVTASSQPLYVVDGVPITTGSFSEGLAAQTNVLADINPNDIESIDVLKDAAAGAIYGARAANGVVLITTKRGKSGKTQFSANYYRGTVNATRRLDMLNAAEYTQLMQEAWENSGGVGRIDPRLLGGKTYEQAISGPSTDWIDAVLRTGIVQEGTVSASGGNEKTRFYVGGTYRNEEGYQIVNAFERASIRVNLDHNATDKLSFGSSSTVSRTQNNRIPTAWAGGLGLAQSRSTVINPIYNEDGTYWNPRGGTNVIAQLNESKYRQVNYRFLNNVYGEYKIIPGLVFRSEFGLDILNQVEDSYKSDVIEQFASSTDRRWNVINWTSTNTFTYSKTFGDNHDLTALLGMKAQRANERLVGASGDRFPNPVLTLPGQGAQPTGFTDVRDYAFLDYFTRVIYKFKSKYIASFIVNRTGSSRFGSGKKFGTFPAASFAWIISDEAFLQNVTAINFLKARVAYGLTGNAEIGNFDYFGSYVGGGNYGGQSGTTPQRPANPDLGWETSAKFDLGLDFSLFDNKVSGALSFYNSYTYNILMILNVPQTTGFNTVRQNVGTMRNRGVEFNVTTKNIDKKDFKWRTELNISANRNMVLNLKGQVLSGVDAGGSFGNTVAVEGYPIATWQLAKWAGVDPETGQEMIYDLEGKKIVATSSNVVANYQFIKDAQAYPLFFGGINNVFNYKGFDFSALLTFSYGNKVYRDDGKFLEGGFDGNWNQMEVVKNRWQKPGDVTDIPRLTLGALDENGKPVGAPDNRNFNTTRYLEDASFLRLKTVSIGYTLPSAFVSKLKMSSVRFYANAQNLAVLTRYPGWDPEVNRDSSNGITQGVTYLAPPQARVITFGINVNF